MECTRSRLTSNVEPRSILNLNTTESGKGHYTMTLREQATIHKEVKEISPFQSTESFELSQRIGRLISFSTLIKQDGVSSEQRLANAVILQDLARTTNLSVFTLAKSVYIIKGTIGFTAEFYRGVVNNSGEFMHRLRFKFNEDRTSCTAYTRDIVDQELIETPPYTIDMAHKEGLFDSQYSKWRTRPDMMLIARVSYMFATLYASHLFLGFENYHKIENLKLHEDDVSEAEII